jgi:hypothetical protein
VPQQQNRLAPAAGKFNLKMIAGLLLLIEGRLTAPVLKYVRQEFTHVIQGCLVVTGRFNLHHALQKGQHLRLVLLAEIKVSSYPIINSLAAHTLYKNNSLSF